MNNDTPSGQESPPRSPDSDRNSNDDAGMESAGPEPRKANILHRTIARVIDLLIALAFYKVIPSVGFWFALVYLFIADGFWSGQSVGKKLLGLRVLRCKAPEAASFKESIIRNFPIVAGFFLLPIPLVGWLFLTVVLGLEFLMVVGSTEGLRIGDELADTVIRDIPSGSRTNDNNIKEQTNNGV